MAALRLALAAGCPKIAANQIMDLCGVYFPDRMRAMTRAERERWASRQPAMAS
jgi:hypothetical protein